ncbi:MAG: Nif3-like dinuclear metal center hexameric protein [Gammaproteobacteria bacterium]
MQRDTLTEYLDQLLSPNDFADYCPNGLQVAGKREIKKIITGVTACQALLEAALESEADAILVHHGYFWKHEDPCVTGLKRDRLATLLKHELNLYAYHLPLDAHPSYGNNVQLARVIGLEVTDIRCAQNTPGLFYIGQLPQALSGQIFAQQIEKNLQRKPFHIAGGDEEIHKVAWCTGAAQNFIHQAVEAKVDAYLTGEVSEQTVHIAREAGLHFYAAGHHATERYGVQALGAHLVEQFNIEHLFIDIDNPV